MGLRFTEELQTHSKLWWGLRRVLAVPAADFVAFCLGLVLAANPFFLYVLTTFSTGEHKQSLKDIPGNHIVVRDFM